MAPVLPLTQRKIGVVAGQSGFELSRLLESHGAEVTFACAVDVVPAPPARLDAELRRLVAASPGWVVISSARGLLELVGTDSALGEATRELLARTRLAIRGSKAVSAASSAGLRAAVVAESGRSEDLARFIARDEEPAGIVGLQVSGGGSLALSSLLARKSLEVIEVRPYRYSQPRERRDLLALVAAAAGGNAEIMVFTSGAAVEGFMEAAEDAGLVDDLRSAFDAEIVAVAVGPATCETLTRVGISRSICPVRPDIRSIPLFLASLGDTRCTPRLEGGRFVRSLDGSRCLALGQKEYSLFASLARRPGLVCPPRTLMIEVWGSEVGLHRLVSLVHRLRRQVMPIGFEIEPLRKRGYRMRATAASHGDKLLSTGEPEIDDGQATPASASGNTRCNRHGHPRTTHV